MMGSEALSSVLNGSPDGVGDTPSGSADLAFHGVGRFVPASFGELRDGTRVSGYWSGKGTFNVRFGMSGMGHSSEVWTTEAGIEAIIGELQATLVRARIAREATA